MVAEIVEAEENSTIHMRAIRVPPVITIKKSAAYALMSLRSPKNFLLKHKNVSQMLLQMYVVQICESLTFKFLKGSVRGTLHSTRERNIDGLMDAGIHAFSIGIIEVINSNLLIELRADDIEYVYQRSLGKILDIIVPTLEACKVGVQLTCLIFGQEI
ncbi:hapless 2 [Perilla frutescens var. frutescens]|nr:hapless 2 [Perilla frutescens var. frutescens]